MENSYETNMSHLREIEGQRKNIISLYDKAAPIYEEFFEGKAEYQIPRILLETYKKHGITGGSVLDIGSGTGKLKEYLGDSFIYEGIDLSPAMISEVRRKGLKGSVGAIEDVIGTLGDKSVDHITALSSLYFIEDLGDLIKEFERVARKSIFISLENFGSNMIDAVKREGITLYNHPISVIKDPTEVIQNVFLWKRPGNDTRVSGSIIFKKI